MNEGQDIYIPWDDIQIDVTFPILIHSGNMHIRNGFTAKKNGVYLFSFTANCCDRNNIPDDSMAEVDIHVMKNGNLYNIIHDHTQSEYGNNISFTWMDNLAQGDRINFLLKLGCLKSTKMTPVIFTAEYTGVTI